MFSVDTFLNLSQSCRVSLAPVGSMYLTSLPPMFSQTLNVACSTSPGAKQHWIAWRLVLSQAAIACEAVRCCRSFLQHRMLVGIACNEGALHSWALAGEITNGLPQLGRRQMNLPVAAQCHIPMIATSKDCNPFWFPGASWTGDGKFVKAVPASSAWSIIST